MNRLSSAFLSKRDLGELKHEELEDLEYHLRHRRLSLQQKMEQITRDLHDLETDQKKVVDELNKRRHQA